MNNKIQIQKLKDNAELAWASYGYFHLADSNYKPDEYSKDGKRLKYFRKLKAKELGRDLDENTYPTPADILNMEYKYFKDKKTGKLKDGFFDDKLFDGDMTPTQAKRFSERYELIHHIPNTLSGFSATIFYDTSQQEYIITFRGTEADTKGILSDVLGADVSLATAGMAITQANALELLSKAIFRAIINHHTLSSKKENSHIYDKNLESMQDSYQSYKSMKDYFSSNNIKVTTTGHLGDTKTLDSIKVA